MFFRNMTWAVYDSGFRDVAQFMRYFYFFGDAVKIKYMTKQKLFHRRGTIECICDIEMYQLNEHKKESSEQRI